MAADHPQEPFDDAAEVHKLHEQWQRIRNQQRQLEIELADLLEKIQRQKNRCSLLLFAVRTR